MYALIGGSCIPEAIDVLMITSIAMVKASITSIAMVKASGEMVHPAIIPTSKHCHVVLNSGVKKLNF